MASSPECGSMTTDSGQDPNDVGEGVKVKEEMLDDPQPKDAIGTGYENGTVTADNNKTEPPSPSPSPSAVVTAALAAAATAAAQQEQQQQRRESVVMTSPLSCVVKSATTPPPPPHPSQSSSSSSSTSSLSPPLTWTTVTAQTNPPPPLRCYTPSSATDSMSVTQQYQQRRQSVVTSVSSAFWNSGTQTSAASTAPGNASAAAASVLSVCRINGVRPELIGGAGFATTAAAATGNTDMKPPAAIPPRTTRSAPTVIMGEAGMSLKPINIKLILLYYILFNSTIWRSIVLCSFLEGGPRKTYFRKLAVTAMHMLYD